MQLEIKNVNRPLSNKGFETEIQLLKQIENGQDEDAKSEIVS